MSFNDDMNRQIQSYKEELKAILNDDVDTLIKNHDLQVEDGEEPSVYDYVNDNVLGSLEPKSGFSLNKDYGRDDFYDDISYVIFNRTVGGPGVNYIVGSNGEAFMTYAWANDFKLIRMSGHDEYNVLNEMAERLYGDKFTANNFEMDDEELDLRRKAEYGVDSFEEWINDNAQVADCEVISFKELLHHLKENDFDLEAAVIDAINEGSFNVCNSVGESYSREDFINDVKAHADTLEKLSLNSDFEDVASIFGVDTDNLTEIDYDTVRDEFESSMEPEEPEVKKKNKPKI